jgi:DNA-binding LacI/PurR family transcriptional regulator
VVVQRTKKRATISDVAKLAGVSISTVSRVVNETAPVADETVQQVRQAIETLDYTPHAAARTLAGRRTGTIGLLLPEISGAFYAPMLRGIEAGARAAGFDLLIHASSHDFYQRTNATLPLEEHNVDGLLVFTNRLTASEITRLYRRGFPLVLLHRSPPAGLDIPCINFENKAGTRRLIEHLIVAHGYRRIGFLAGPADNEDSYWRERGYREALEAHGLPFAPDLCGVGAFDEDLAEAAVETWLRQGVALDAIFGGDDEGATGAMHALRRAGQRVPEDVAVVGFDDVPFARLMAPPLTTVRAPIELAGQQAASQLIALIQGGEAASSTLLPTELVIRRSCGCA